MMMRRAARQSLAAYAQSVDIPGKPFTDDDEEWLFHPIETGIAAHHFLIMELLQELALGRLRTAGGIVIRNVMIFAPPGSAKSTYTSVLLPTWLLGRIAEYRIILASYAMAIARKQGRRARQIARSKRFSAVWGVGLSAETSAQHEWALTNGSEFMATGILGAATGNRADGLIIDDPVAGRAEADSAVVRKSTAAAYEDDLKTRLKPGGWQVIMQTRWHEMDLSGGILPEGWHGESGDFLCRDGEWWRVLCLPAIAEPQLVGLDGLPLSKITTAADIWPGDPLGREPGEILWPQWFTPEHFGRFKNNARTWSALYQQVPTPPTGTYFLRDWIVEHNDAPVKSRLKTYIASDYAVTGDGGDYTVHLVFGVDPLGQVWLLDIWRKQATSDEWVEAFIDLVEKWKPSQTAHETGQIDKSIGPYLVRRLKKRKVYTYRNGFPTSGGDKAIRAQSIRGLMSVQGLHVILGTEGLADFINELLSFPAGHDDQVDALGLFGQLLDRIAEGKEPVGPDDNPAKLEYRATVDGRTVSNMRLDRQVDDFIKRQRRKRLGD